MKNDLLNLLFLFQLEEYDIEKVSLWLKNNSLKNLVPEKKKLVFTFKIRVLLFLAGIFKAFGQSDTQAVFQSVRLISFPEQIVKSAIVFLAKLKLLFNRNLIVIGVTGSFAKTSVKEILFQILSSRYRVLKTPESYNTPLGIAKIILANLSFRHQIFIVEMGAYKKGDIKNICDFVKPQIGILTAIGKQHLERFGSLENTKNTKAELLESLPKNGLAIINGDNPYCLDLATKLTLKSFVYKIKQTDQANSIRENLFFTYAQNIKSTISGSSFQIKNGREVLNFKTPLLGSHSVSNILPALLLSRELEFSWEDLQKQISLLSPISHRLELLKGANDTYIIDDSYNANPDSVNAALSVLKNFDSPRKIVITPGLVELGSQQDKENEKFGQNLSKVADFLIVVGNTNKEALKKGFLYPNKLIECLTLNEATEKLQEIVIPKAVILFENDLPDQYL